LGNKKILKNHQKCPTFARRAGRAGRRISRPLIAKVLLTEYLSKTRMVVVRAAGRLGGWVAPLTGTDEPLTETEKRGYGFSNRLTERKRCHR
jgi:hypothetical protein